MRLKEWDWNASNYAEVEYADGPIKEFVDWFRTTRQWRENPEQVYGRWMKFERDLKDAKATPAGDICAATKRDGAPCKAKAVKDGLCIAHLKARAA